MSRNVNAAYRVANKVALNMRYVDTTSDPLAAREMLVDSLNTLKSFLDQLNPPELRERFGRIHESFVHQGKTIRTSQRAAQRFTAGGCDQMRSMGLHEKIVAVIGTRLAQWDRRPITFRVLGDSLDSFLTLLDQSWDQLADAMQFDPVFRDRARIRTKSLSDFACGLALVMIPFDRDTAGAADIESSLTSAAMANFGAKLVVQSSAALSRACSEQPF